MARQNILVVEDNIETAENIRLYLDHHGFDCDVMTSGTDGLKAFSQGRYDLVILDLMLPDLDGQSVCRQLRQHSEVPVIMLTAKVTDQNVADGLDAGADDYIRKPYSNKELVARVKAHLRRHAPRADRKSAGPYEIDETACTASAAGNALKLTRTEFLLLQGFVKAPGRVFSRDQLFELAFDHTHDSFDQTINVHLHNLRKKVAAAGVKDHGIKSVYGLGYKLVIS